MPFSYFDLTHTCASNMSVYPGDPSVSVREISSVPTDGFRLHRLVLSSHAGTHMDAAAHVFAEGATLADCDCSCFTGYVCVADCRAIEEGGKITPAIVEKALQGAKSAQWVLFATGWDRFWTKEAYYTGPYPVLDPEAIDLLVRMNLSGVGFDTPGPDAFGELHRHRALLSRVPLLLENLTGLTDLSDFLHDHSGACARMFAFPLKFDCPDGAPVRAVVEVNG